MRRYKGKCDIFFGTEHRLKKEEMEEQFTRETKEGWRFAADAAIITDETAGSEDRKHTSGVFVAVDSNLGAVVGDKEGAIDSISGNEGSIAQAWVNVRGVLRVFSVYFWHSKGWTARNEALLETVLMHARTSRLPRFIACDANMCPEEFEKSLWFQKGQMHVVALKEASTCRSKGPKGEHRRKMKRRRGGQQRDKSEMISFKEKASAHEDAKSTAPWTVGQSVKQSLDCSQIENEEEGEEEDWQKEDQMEVQWAEDEKLEESLERRRMEGSSLQAEVMHKST